MIRTLICSTASVCAFLMALPEFDHVKSQRLAMTRNQELLLQQDCEAMNAEGRIRELMTEIHRAAQELENLNSVKAEERDIHRISRIRDEIHQLVLSAENILRPDWTEDKWPYMATWNIRFTDVLSIDESVINANFTFTNFELENLSLGGIERDDLYPLITVTPSPRSIRVEIEKRASSLELCQLQPTWIVAGIVKYKFLGKPYEDRSELTLRPGVSRPPPPIVPKPKWPPEFHIEPSIECLLSQTCPKEQLPRPLPFPSPIDPWVKQ